MLIVTFDCHIYEFKYNVGKDEYSFQTVGGRIFLVCLIAFYLARHFGLNDLAYKDIIGLSVVAMIVWDVLTIYLAHKKKQTRFMRYEGLQRISNIR